MGEQMSIFDFIQIPEQSLEEMAEDEIIEKIEAGTGLRFWANTRFGNYYETKLHGVTFYIHLSRYDLDDNRSRFIGVGWDGKKQGASAPRDSVKDAIEWIQAQRKRFLPLEAAE